MAPLENNTEITTTLPVLPLRDVVVYPHMVIPLFVGREKSIKALESAMEQNKEILLVAQRMPLTMSRWAVTCFLSVLSPAYYKC